ncbi:MAG: transposase domain-containing protein, partial [Gemmataceae bacterium]|nr:transposase domain-containing protein [Gemmataceae bacterium]
FKKSQQALSIYYSGLLFPLLDDMKYTLIYKGTQVWLFVGSDRGGETAAILYSFTSTCHRLGVEPWAYLQDVLTRLPTLSAERVAELLPDRWQAGRVAQPSAAAVIVDLHSHEPG